MLRTENRRPEGLRRPPLLGRPALGMPPVAVKNQGPTSEFGFNVVYTNVHI
jgi:hypothetical protein